MLQQTEFCKNKRHWSLLSGLLILLLLSGCSEPVKQVKEVIRPIKLFTVQDNSRENIRLFPAKVFASDEAYVSFRISGELIDFPVNQADEVKKGQLLARLDDRDLRNTLAVKQSDYELAMSDYKRMKVLRRKRVVSQSDLDTISARLKSTSAALQQAKDQLGYATLKAPFDGRIAQTLVENYQFVQAKESILVLQSNNTLDISIQVPENIMSRIQEEDVDKSYQPLVSFSGKPGARYKSSYKEHATTVNPGTQSYTVVFTMPIPKDLTIYPGMGATVMVDLSKIITTNSKDVSFIIPLSAVLKNDSKGVQQVWLYNAAKGTVDPKTVTVGRITQEGAVITSGLEQGDQIAAAGLNRLRAGMKVKPLVRERGL